MSMWHARWLTVWALCLLTLAGCAPRQSYKYRIVVIPKGLTHQHWQSVHRGAERAAADLTAAGIAVQVIWDGPLKESDALEQIGIVDRHIGARVNGIVLAPQHSVQMVAPVERAVRGNIPVVIIDSALNKPELTIKYVATDNYQGGRLAAEHLLDVLRKDGKPAPKLILFRYQLGSESTEQREKGFIDRVEEEIARQKKAGEPTITWLWRDDEYASAAGATVDSAERSAGPLLSRLRDQGIDGIFAVNESAATGMLNTLRSLGLHKKVRLMAFDISEPLRQALREGDVVGTIVQDPYKMGYLSVWYMVQQLEGFDVGPNGKKEVSTGEHVVTRESLDAAATQELFDPDLQKQRKIDTPRLEKGKR